MIKLMAYFLLFFSFGVWSDEKAAQELVTNFSSKIYYPQNAGLKDLQVDIEIPVITKQLNDKLVFGELSKVFFRVYWNYPDVLDVEVIGMPDGFYQIKNNLRSMIAARVDLIVPKDFSKMFEGYQFKLLEDKSVVAEDETRMKAVTKYNLSFDSKGILAKLLIESDMTETSSFVFDSDNTTGGHLLLKENDVHQESSTQKTSIKNMVSYKQIDGFVLPTMLNSNIEQFSAARLKQKGRKKAYRRKFKTVILFKNYLINKEKASQWFKEHKPMNL